MREPELTRNIALLHEMQEDRAWIVNSYAQVEYLFADTVMRCRDFAEYAELTATLPYHAEKRVSRFTKLVELEGPLAEQRTDFRSVISAFQEWGDRRQFLVHGYAQFRHTPQGDAGLFFRRFMPTKDEPFRTRTMWFRPHTLRAIRDEVVAQGEFAMQTFMDLHRRLGWTENEEVFGRR